MNLVLFTVAKEKGVGRLKACHAKLYAPPGPPGERHAKLYAMTGGRGPEATDGPRGVGGRSPVATESPGTGGRDLGATPLTWTPVTPNVGQSTPRCFDASGT